MSLVQPDLSQEPGPEWQRHVVAPSTIEVTPDGWRFTNNPLEGRQYTNAQIDDYQGRRRGDFPWRAPVSLTVSARFSHPFGELVGTAGFGFWNDPLVMSGLRLPALPRAIWFFHGSPHNNIRLDLHTPGCGWKAATVDANRLPAYLLAPALPLAVPLMNIRPVYRTLWPAGQRAIAAREALLDIDMTAWHTYQLDWGVRGAEFRVDGEPVLRTDAAPRGRLGFVMWIDNQAMVATPWGRVGWRTVPIEQPQWMEIGALRIESAMR